MSERAGAMEPLDGPPAQATVAFVDGVAIVRGRVEHGDRRGRELGFPTANLRLGDVSVRDGVWAGRVLVGRSRTPYVTAVSIGRRPTFYRRNGERLLEAYLLDFSAELYGVRIRVELHQLLRPQRRFHGAPELIEQLALDVAHTRDWARQQVEAGNSGGPARVRPSGHPFPVRAHRAVPDADRLQQLRARREARRREIVARAAREALAAGDMTHESVAHRSGIPLGHLLWAYPGVQDLLHADL